MKNSTKNIMILAAIGIFFVSTSICAHAAGWVSFSSQSGFEILYPRAWTRLTVPPTTLAISSSSNKVEAVIIPRGAKMIFVREIKNVDNSDYLSSFKKENPDDQVIKYFSVALWKKNYQSCEKVFIIESNDEVGPNVYYIEDHMYCSVGKRSFVLTLTQWKADRFDRTAFDIGIDMLASLRL